MTSRFIDTVIEDQAEGPKPAEPERRTAPAAEPAPTEELAAPEPESSPTEEPAAEPKSRRRAAQTEE